MAVEVAQGLTPTFESVLKLSKVVSADVFCLYIDEFEQDLSAHPHMLDTPSLTGRRLLPALLYADDLHLISISAQVL